MNNYFELFNGILNPSSSRAFAVGHAVPPAAVQRRRRTAGRLKPSAGVTCFDCHVNGHYERGHASGGRHSAAGVPPPHRHAYAARRQHPAAVRLAAGLKSVEDFTEFEQRAAYFDGDPVIATKKGVNILERGSQVHFMAEFQAILDFPPAPKLNVYGTLDPWKEYRQWKFLSFWAW
jgi:hypothetical protein